jgi:hypothetical protein
MVFPATTVYLPSASPATPLRRKTTRLAAHASPQFDILADSPVHNRTMLSLPSHTDVLPSPGLAVARVSGGTTSTGSNPSVPSPGRVNRSLQLLESQAHTVRLEIRAREQESKATPKTYGRHVNSYQSWWDLSEAAKAIRDPTLAALPALSIIAAKVAMFLQYESTREKVCPSVEVVF